MPVENLLEKFSNREEKMGEEIKSQGDPDFKMQGTGVDEKPPKEKNEKPKLFDLYRHADDAGRYERSLEQIKTTAEQLSSDLYDLGVTNLPPESNLGQAFITADKVAKNYQNIEEAKSAMERIAELISGEIDNKEKSSENKNEKQETINEINKSLETLIKNAEALNVYALSISAQLEKAEKENIDIDLGEVKEKLSEFQDSRKYGTQIPEMRKELFELTGFLFDKGIKITNKELAKIILANKELEVDKLKKEIE